MLLREPWRTRLLFGSFALNLFTLALIGAHFAMRGRPGPPPPERIVEHMVHGLAAPDAERFRAVMAQRLPAIEAAHDRMEQARTAMAVAIAREPYDEAAVRRAMKDWQTAWMSMSDGMGDGVLSAVSTLSPDGRKRLADAGLRRPGR
jgi:uncharacterized membrane protein